MTTASGRSAIRTELTALAVEAGHRVSSGNLRWSRIDVEVRRRPLERRLGGLIYRWGHRVALVDERLSQQVAEFVAAHEVGHMILSHAVQDVSETEEELLCDMFATEMLRAAGRSTPRPDFPAAVNRQRSLVLD